MYILIISLGDPVSRTFFNALGRLPLVVTKGDVEVMKFRDMYVIVHRGEPTEFNREDIAAEYGKYAVFISRHEMANPKPLYTVHTPGAWPEVSIANPCLASNLYRFLCKNAAEPFKCAFEATHHPPNTSHISATFLEVGSGEAQWLDKRAVSLLVDAVEDIVVKNCAGRSTMVVGDLHYVTVGDYVLNGEIDLGHVIPKYVEITKTAVENALYKHIDRVERVVIFRKNVKNPTRGEIITFLKSVGVEVVIKG
ncbi:MAG: D-aminoacyl-tRNA deacylase [Pyrobaculum sp.]